VTAQASDEGGDPIQYAFTADDGLGFLATVGPQSEPAADFDLPPGEYTITVSATDGSACSPAAANAACTESHVVPEAPPPGAEFLRGDCDGDGFVGGAVNDPVFYLNWAFGTGPEPDCKAACDADGNGFVGGSVTDPVYYLNWAFLGGPGPVAPFPDCGPGGPLDEALGCELAPEKCN
jgi:hypothetical protein